MIILRQNKTRFQVRVTIQGKQFVKTFRNKGCANSFHRELLLRKHRIEAGLEILENNMTLRNFILKECFEVKIKGVKTTSTERTYFGDVNKNIVPIIGNIPLSKLTIADGDGDGDGDGEKVINKLEKRKRKVKTINKHISLLKSICKYAIQKQYLNKNPFEFLERKKEPQTQKEFLREEDCKDLLRVSKVLFNGIYYPLISTAIHGNETWRACITKMG